jgi:type II secretory pathway pseudopilin PulG
MPLLNAPKKVLGFTLIEILVIILVVGILSAIAIPSFMSLIDKVNVNNAVTDVRAALQTGQREAIRRSQVCTVGLNSLDGKVTNYCSSDERDLPDRITFATNISKDNKLPGNPIRIDFGVLGTADFNTEESEDSDTDSENNQSSIAKPKYLEVSSPPSSKQKEDNNDKDEKDEDPSGKIVFYVANNPALGKKCIAISNTLGLTRTGNYTGKIEKNSKLSKKGVCTAS